MNPNGRQHKLYWWHMPVDTEDKTAVGLSMLRASAAYVAFLVAVVVLIAVLRAVF